MGFEKGCTGRLGVIDIRMGGRGEDQLVVADLQDAPKVLKAKPAAQVVVALDNAIELLL
ncbi:MAG: hypothetical protein PVH87_03335 [Desulfobacteraceae bacterium]